MNLLQLNPVRAMRWLSRVTAELPGVRWLSQQEYRRRFSGELYGFCCGVFASFDEARQSAPHSKPMGFDVPDFTHEYRDRLVRVFAYDYPILYWLRPLLLGADAQEGARRIFDIGGHVGVHYYAYRKYLKYPQGLTWTVCEVPEIARAGAEIARERDCADSLRFTSDMQGADGADILLAAGSIQYVEKPLLHAVLASLSRPPKHLFINKVPLYDKEPYVTLQNAGPTFVPHHVFNRAEFRASIEKLGYALIDTWDNPGRPCAIPFHPDRHVDATSGLYFRMDAS